MYRLETSNSDYKKFIKENKYYVDKTLFIEEIINKTSEVVLITRPRRFGKTLNLSMLKYYFDISENNEHLFKNKKISKEHKDLFNKYLNKYPVIFLTLKEIKGLSWEDDYKNIKALFHKLYKQYNFLLESNKLLNSEKEDIKAVLDKKDEIDYETCIERLCSYLHSHYDKKVIVLMDEYDAMLNKMMDEEHYKKALNFLRNTIGSTFKGNDYLEKGILTGILRVAKESIFSGANNIAVRTILSDDFSDKFGFTKEEVDYSLKQFNLQDKAEEVKDWYNGYSFGYHNKVTIYNPFSLVNYLGEKKVENYWINSGKDLFIRNLLFNSSFEIKTALLELINGKTIKVDIEENITMNELDNPENLWSLLLFSGYITALSKEEYQYDVVVVNKEVKHYLIRMVRTHFNRIIGSAIVLDALIREDLIKFEEELKRIAESKISYHDVTSENSYHMFLLGLFINLEKEYDLKSNREEGFGRYDLMLEPYNKNKVGYIIELKKVEPVSDIDEKLKKASLEALEQIITKKYALSLKEKVARVIGIGIAFCGKKVELTYKDL